MNSGGEAIRKLRTDRRMSQRALARAVGINFTYICRIERGKLEAPPSEALVKRIARALEADPDWLCAEMGVFDLKAIRAAARASPNVCRILRAIAREWGRQ